MDFAAKHKAGVATHAYGRLRFKVFKGMATMTWAGLRSLIDMPLTLPISRWILLLSFKLKPKLVSSRFENFADLLLAEKNADVFIVIQFSI